MSGYDQLNACYQVQHHIDDSIEKLQQCQRIVGLVAIAERHIQQGQLFHALRVLDKLRHEITQFRVSLEAERPCYQTNSIVMSDRDEYSPNG